MRYNYPVICGANSCLAHLSDRERKGLKNSRTWSSGGDSPKPAAPAVSNIPAKWVCSSLWETESIKQLLWHLENPFTMIGTIQLKPSQSAFPVPREAAHPSGCSQRNRSKPRRRSRRHAVATPPSLWVSGSFGSRNKARTESQAATSRFYFEQQHKGRRRQEITAAKRSDRRGCPERRALASSPNC